MAHDVFISYAAEDKPTADAVCARLEVHRIRCWIAPRDVLPSMDYGQALVEAIRHSRLMILVFSARSNDSPHVKREVERASSRGIPILPFRIEDVTLSASLEYFIAGSHWLDALTPPLERHLEHLAETVNLLLARTAGPQDLAAEQAQDARAAEERALVPSSLGLVLAKAGLRARAAVSGLGHVVERLRTSPRVLLAATVGLGGVGIAAVLLVLFLFHGQDSGVDSLSKSPVELSAVALTSSPTQPPAPTVPPTQPPAPTVPPTQPPAPTQREYPSAIREGFLNGCLETSGDLQEYCSCALDEVQKEYDLEEFIELSTQMANTGQIPEKLAGVIAKCIHLIPIPAGGG
jgi:hypothetical protein